MTGAAIGGAELRGQLLLLMTLEPKSCIILQLCETKTLTAAVIACVGGDYVIQGRSIHGFRYQSKAYMPLPISE